MIELYFRLASSMFMRVLHRNFGVHTHRALVDQLAAEIAGNADQQAGQPRDIKAPGPNVGIGLTKTQQPIERCQGKQHDREGGVAPGRNQPADTRHCHQVDHTHQPRKPSASSAHPAQPDTCTRPKIILGTDIGEIHADKRNQRCDGEMDQHRVNGMSANRHAANDRFMVHDYAPIQWLSRWLGLGVLTNIAGCGGPLSTLDPAGPAAQSAAGLWWIMFGSFGLVLLAVIGLWWFAMRQPSRSDNPRRNNRMIIGGGVLLPLLSIAGLLAVGIPAGHRMLPLPTPEDVLRIDVTGHQWWWEVHYPDTGVRLKNELHIPAGAPVDIHLTTADVIHAFWVPRLGGKLDAIPGRTNILRLQASQPGIYRGQCAEFCGLHHAHMQFSVTAYEVSDFQRWLTEASTND